MHAVSGADTTGKSDPLVRLGDNFLQVPWLPRTLDCIWLTLYRIQLPFPPGSGAVRCSPPHSPNPT